MNDKLVLIGDSDFKGCGCSFKYHDNGGSLTLEIERCVQHFGVGNGYGGKDLKDVL